MFQKFKHHVVHIGAVLAVAYLALLPMSVQAVDVICGTAEQRRLSQVCNSANDRLFGPGSIWTNIINTILFVIGAIAVLMIVIGAMRYALSAGDQNQITSAKNTILYAVIGLVIALMAGGIVNFVLARI